MFNAVVWGQGLLTGWGDGVTWAELAAANCDDV